MRLISEKIMFEIYRDPEYDGLYRVVYFTELDDHNKEFEIDRALAGEHVYDGFLSADHIDQAKDLIDQWLDRLNSGQRPDTLAFEQALTDFMAK